MPLVLLAGTDRGLLTRWSSAALDARFDCITVTPEVLTRRAPLGAELCLFDLGDRPNGDAAPLRRAIAVCREIAFVAMTAHPEVTEGLRLLHSGVRGYCNRLAHPGVLGTLLATVQGGEIWAGRQVTDHLLRLAMASSEAGPAHTSLTRLTPRETAIATEVAAGKSNKLIAADIGVSEATVKAHLNRIFRKLGVHSRVQLTLALTRSETPVSRLSSA